MWIIFSLVVTVMLALDLLIFHRKAHKVKIKEAIVWSIIWIALALLFNIGIYFAEGKEAALKFLTGYIVEKSLSVDNLFVFIVIFTYFGIESIYQHKILFWGIIGALITRGIFISTGVTIVQSLHWILYVFGVFLIITGIKLAFQTEDQIHPEKNLAYRIFKRFFSFTHEHAGGKFFIRQNGILIATPLFVTLLVIETTDVVFALDSIPAILGITIDPFIVFSSNIFAILGLRALYFVLAGFMQMFRYLHYGLSIILIFIGVKMLIEKFVVIPIEIALGVVAVILIVSVIMSVINPEKKNN